MGADYYLVNTVTKVKLDVMGRAGRIYNSDMLAEFLLDNEDQEIMLVELNTLTELENPEPYNYQPYVDYEVEWSHRRQGNNIEN